jgi:hypothetical protein
MWSNSAAYGGGAMIRQDDDQRYLTFFLNEDVSLGEIEAALKGSEFSIPRDRLRVFGHVVLEFDVGKTPSKELVAALDAVDHTSVAESKVENGLCLVTAQMPYPIEERRNRESVGWENFGENDLASERGIKSDWPVSPRALPRYETFRSIAAKHNASLSDMRWSTRFACRTVGCVRAPEANATIAATLERDPVSGD